MLYRVLQCLLLFQQQREGLMEGSAMVQRNLFIGLPPKLRVWTGLKVARQIYSGDCCPEYCLTNTASSFHFAELNHTRHGMSWIEIPYELFSWPFVSFIVLRSESLIHDPRSPWRELPRRSLTSSSPRSRLSKPSGIRNVRLIHARCVGVPTDANFCSVASSTIIVFDHCELLCRLLSPHTAYLTPRASNDTWQRGTKSN